MNESPDARGTGDVEGVWGRGSAMRLSYFVTGVLTVLHMAAAYRFGEWDPS